VRAELWSFGGFLRPFSSTSNVEFVDKSCAYDDDQHFHHLPARLIMQIPAARRALYAAGLVLGLLGVWLLDQPPPTPLVQSEPRASAGTGLRGNLSELPELELRRLTDRPARETTADPFESDPWARAQAEEARGNAPLLPPPPPPQAPPLPFAYVGKLIDASTTVVFLTKGDRNYVVRVDDTIDGAYRVDEISERAMTFTYLPLDFKQSLGVGESASSYPPLAELPTPGAPLAKALRAATPAVPAQLVWLAPPRVEIGEEFTIEVGLPSGPQPRSGRVELVYDPRILALLGGAAASGGGTAKRALVDVIGPGILGSPPTPSEVRFRVLADDPTSTQIRIENVSAVTGGSSLAVVSPDVHRLAIIHAPSKQR